MTTTPKNIDSSSTSLREAMDRYCPQPSKGKVTQYVDPFSLPYYAQPTYEASNAETRFNKEKKVAGYSLSEFSSLDDLYDLMLPADYQRNVHLAIQTLNYRNLQANTPDEVLHYQLEVCLKLRGKNGKLYYYKRTSNENGMIDGKISHAISYWEDISFMTKGQQSYWKLSAKNSEFFDVELPELGLYQGVLSNREAELLRLLAKGFRSYDISRMMNITKNTVDTHRRNMLRKMEASNTPELIDIARDMGLC